MSIETKIDELIAALKANTAAHTGKAGTASTGTTTSTASTGKSGGTKTTKAAYEARFDKASAQALANRVKDEKGVQTIRGIIKDLGYEKLVDISKPEDLDKLADKCKDELGEGGDEGGGSDDDGI